MYRVVPEKMHKVYALQVCSRASQSHAVVSKCSERNCLHVKGQCLNTAIKYSLFFGLHGVETLRDENHSEEFQSLSRCSYRPARGQKSHPSPPIPADIVSIPPIPIHFHFHPHPSPSIFIPSLFHPRPRTYSRQQVEHKF